MDDQIEVLREASPEDFDALPIDEIQQREGGV
jgi:hypothetical protein